MSITSRLARLEKEHGTNGEACPHGWLILRYTEAKTAEDVAALDAQAVTPCSQCGRQRNILRVAYVEDWRANDENSKQARAT